MPPAAPPDDLLAALPFVPPEAPADPVLPLPDDDCEEDDDDDEDEEDDDDETGGMLPGLPEVLDDELLLSGLLSGSEPHPAATIATTLIRKIAARCIAVTPTADASQIIIARRHA